MNQIAFYGGMVLVVVGLSLWVSEEDHQNGTSLDFLVGSSSS
jgi:hypothetical protein